VTSEVGIVGNNSTGELESIRVAVTGAAGSDQIDLSETTIQAVGPNGQANLVFTDEAANGTSLVNNESTYNASSLNASEFAVQDSQGDWVSSGGAVLDDENDYTIVLNPGAEPFGSLTADGTDGTAVYGGTWTYAHQTADEEAFGQSQSSSLEIVSPASATTHSNSLRPTSTAKTAKRSGSNEPRIAPNYLPGGSSARNTYFLAPQRLRHE